MAQEDEKLKSRTIFLTLLIHIKNFVLRFKVTPKVPALNELVLMTS
jgi:hypothetical protein